MIEVLRLLKLAAVLQMILEQLELWSVAKLLLRQESNLRLCRRTLIQQFVVAVEVEVAVAIAKL